jgi:hypothetical protein
VASLSCKEALMHPQAYPTASLHLVHGLWIASCPTCGFELSRSRDRAKVERAAARHRCPVCHPTALGPRNRGLRLLGPLAEFHRAVDRLRWDTIRTPPATQSDPPGRPGPRPGQGGLLDHTD